MSRGTEGEAEMNRTRSLLSRLGLGRVALFAFAAMVLAMTTSASAQLPTTLYIGEGSWKITVTPDAAAAAAGRVEFTEYSVVEGTRVVMHEMARLGFKTTSLTATPLVAMTTYNMTITSRDNGKVVITGTATLSTNNGTAVWTLPDGKSYTYTYTGVPHTPVDAES
jgi:hypothetical protein